MTHVKRIDEMVSNDFENNELYEVLINNITQYGIGDEDAENMAQYIITSATDYANTHSHYFGNISNLVHEWLMKDWRHLFGTEEEFDNFCQDVAMSISDIM